MDSEIQLWLERDPDPATRDELRALAAAGDRAELARRFGGRLEFGTAGLRGVVGAGPAMMNQLVIRETSAGLGSYLLQQVDDAASRGILVAYDARPDSRRFAEDAACVFAALGITVYLTEKVAPTPVAAFGVVRLGAAAGVVVTASHNPPEYNGYKVFWENGAQIIPPHDAGIAAAIVAAANEDIPLIDADKARTNKRIIPLGGDFYRSYVDAIQASPLFSGTVGENSIGIAYTAMHGVGAELAETLLGEAGFENLYSVGAQREPDGSFPTVDFPNPEEPGAMDAVVALAKEHGLTLACANDPDADRLAVAVRNDSGEYELLSGDAIGVLLGDYLLGMRHDFVPIVGTTIVSSSMLKPLAAAAGAVYCETLTGLKWLANVTLGREDERHRFLFAYEEALGYAAGRQVRDKDGLSALLAFAQMTDSLARDGKTVFDRLEALYRTHGIFLTAQRSIASRPGAQSIGAILRQSPPRAVGGRRVLQVEDLWQGKRRFADGSQEDLDLPRSDVLVYRLEHGARLIVRPSGTEPKVKCYYEIVATVGDEVFSSAMGRAKASLSALIEVHQDSLTLLREAGGEAGD